MVIIIMVFIVSVLFIIIGTEDDSKLLITLGVILAFSGEFAAYKIYQPDKKEDEKIIIKEEKNMSTRAHIRIIDGDELFQMYHHFDGYPEGVGSDLKKFLETKCCKNYWDGEEIANALVKGRVAKDDGYEVTSCLHGDEDYVYVIDCDNREFKCYKHGWAEEFDKTVIEKNLVKIGE